MFQIHSAKDLEQEFSEIQKHYQDKETEHNWQVRERAITWTRCILRGNAPEVYSEVLVQGLKNMVDGIIKAVSVCWGGESLYLSKKNWNVTTKK